MCVLPCAIGAHNEMHEIGTRPRVCAPPKLHAAPPHPPTCRLRKQRDALDDQIHRLTWRNQQLGCAAGGGFGSNASSSDDMGAMGAGGAEEGGAVDAEEGEEERAACAATLANLQEQRGALRDKHRRLLREHHERFHPVWGQLFCTGYQLSRYGHQMERFACLFTSHIANLLYYSPLKSYRGKTDELLAEDDLWM